MAEKAKRRTCPRCPHSLSDFHTHETTPEPMQSVTDEELLQEAQITPLSIASPSEEGTPSRIQDNDTTSSKEKCPWLSTIYGQTHVKFCPAGDACPFRIYLAKRSTSEKFEIVGSSKAQGSESGRKDTSHVLKEHINVCPALSSRPADSTSKIAGLAILVGALESGQVRVDRDAGKMIMERPGGCIQDANHAADLVESPKEASEVAAVPEKTGGGDANE